VVLPLVPLTNVILRPALSAATVPDPAANRTRPPITSPDPPRSRRERTAAVRAAYRAIATRPSRGSDARRADAYAGLLMTMTRPIERCSRSQ
jgi:hypothetical protein